MKISWSRKYFVLNAACLLLQNCDTTAKKDTADETKVVATPGFYTAADFDKVEKYDTHVHINAVDATFIGQAKKDKFIGAHLGSFEGDVDELAKRLDKFPNMAVDMAARIVHLEYQAAGNWQKVNDFMIKYQDRLLYATDGGIEANADINKSGIHARKISDWQFFTSNDTMTSADFDQSFKGLKLPKQVIDKIYRTNAEKWYPGIRNFKKKITA